MAISIVQTASNSTTDATSVTVTLSSGTTSGNTLVAAIYAGTTISGVTLGGSAGNWASQASIANSAGPVALWADPGCAGSQTSVTVTQASANGLVVFVYEVSGLLTSSILDQSATAGGTPAGGTSWSSGATGTTSQASEIAFGVFAGYNNYGNATTATGPGSPWVNEAQVTPQTGVWLLTGYDILSSAGTVTYSGTASGTNLSGNMYYGAVVATFKAAAPSFTSSGSIGLGALGVSGTAASANLGGNMGLPAPGMSGTVSVTSNVTTSGALHLPPPGMSAGIIPPSMEVFANIPSGTVTSGGTDAPAAGTSETWTVTAGTAFSAASAAATPPTFFYAADPAANSEMMLVTACPGGSGAGQAWTVTRGADGTTPVTHAAGFAVVQVLSHASYAALQTVSGTTNLSGGSAVVACSSVTAVSLIQVTSQHDGGTPGWLRISARTPGVSFTITSSSATDTSTVAYSISQG